MEGLDVGRFRFGFVATPDQTERGVGVGLRYIATVYCRRDCVDTAERDGHRRAADGERLLGHLL